jgi:L-threonylcarbamoyladenylate synthase
MKRTLLLEISSFDLLEKNDGLARAAAILRAGGTVAFPTETVYGLGANALSEAAVRGIFEAKQRPSWDPLIVHVTSEQMLAVVAREVSTVERSLMQSFWPGPLTLLLPRSESVPELVTAGRPKVGVRRSAHPVARALIDLAGIPIAAPSANSFGRISPTTAQHVL